MTNPEQPSNIRDVGTSLIRTFVPALWGSLLAWGSTQVPALEPALNQPGVTGLGMAIAGALIVAWYSLWRGLESRLPAWLTVLVLGSNRPPTYEGRVIEGTATVVRDEPHVGPDARMG